MVGKLKQLNLYRVTATSGQLKRLPVLMPGHSTRQVVEVYKQTHPQCLNVRAKLVLSLGMVVV